jgi:hypothetical protein
MLYVPHNNSIKINVKDIIFIQVPVPVPRTVSSSGNRGKDLSSVANPDPHPFGKRDPDQHLSEKLDPDPHQILKKDPDPEQHQNQNYGAVGAKNGAMEGRKAQSEGEA